MVRSPVIIITNFSTDPLLAVQPKNQTHHTTYIHTSYIHWSTIPRSSLRPHTSHNQRRCNKTAARTHLPSIGTPRKERSPSVLDATIVSNDRGPRTCQRLTFARRGGAPYESSSVPSVVRSCLRRRVVEPGGTATQVLGVEPGGTATQVLPAAGTKEPALSEPSAPLAVGRRQKRLRYKSTTTKCEN